MPIQLTPIPPSDTYSADADVYKYGPDDVSAYADLNNNGDAGEIAAQLAWARREAYNWINGRLRKAGLTAPATADTFSEFDQLPSIEAERAIAVLYFARGKNEQQAAPGADGAMQWHYEEAGRRLTDVIETVQANDSDDNTNPPGTLTAVPVEFDPTAAWDENPTRWC